MTPEQREAKKALYRALKDGRLVRAEACELCSKIQTHRGLDAHHHHGYEDPLDVQWLCQGCHNAVHGGPKHAGLKHSEEVKERIKASLREAYTSGRRAKPDLSGPDNPFYGRKHTPEARAKIAAARRRK